MLCAGLPIAYLAHGPAADILAAHELDGPGIAGRVLGYLGGESNAGAKRST